MNIKNQNGFATLEIILVIGIIAIFSTVAVPKMARILDKVALNYEMKHLYSELNLARSIGKSSNFNASIFDGKINSDGSTGLYIYKKSNNYEIKRENLKASNYNHNLRNGITLTFDNKLEYPITFENPSRYSSGSNTITLTSKYGDSAKIIFDSVGRWRGTYEK